MRPSLFLAPAVLASIASPAFAQLAQPLPIATVTCRDIAAVEPAYQAALIYYAAGYRDGLDYGLSVQGAQLANSSSAQLPSTALGSAAPSAPSTQAEASAAIAAPSTAASAAPNATVDSNDGGSNKTGIVAGLTLQPQDIIGACRAAPDALLTDIIVNHGGATGPHGSPGAAVNATPSGGAVVNNGAGDVTGNGAASAPAGGGTSSTTNAGSGAVSSDLDNASAQNQQNVATPPGTVPGTTANPAAGTTPGATGAGAGTTSP